MIMLGNGRKKKPNSPSLILLIQKSLSEFLAIVPQALMLGFEIGFTENLMENGPCWHTVVSSISI